MKKIKFAKKDSNDDFNVIAISVLEVAEKEIIYKKWVADGTKDSLPKEILDLLLKLNTTVDYVERVVMKDARENAKDGRYTHRIDIMNEKQWVSYSFVMYLMLKFKKALSFVEDNEYVEHISEILESSEKVLEKKFKYEANHFDTVYETAKQLSKTTEERKTMEKVDKNKISNMEKIITGFEFQYPECIYTKLIELHQNIDKQKGDKCLSRLIEISLLVPQEKHRKKIIKNSQCILIIIIKDLLKEIETFTQRSLGISKNGKTYNLAEYEIKKGTEQYLIVKHILDIVGDSITDKDFLDYCNKTLTKGSVLISEKASIDTKKQGQA